MDFVRSGLVATGGGGGSSSSSSGTCGEMDVDDFSRMCDSVGGAVFKIT